VTELQKENDKLRVDLAVAEAKEEGEEEERGGGEKVKDDRSDGKSSQSEGDKQDVAGILMGLRSAPSPRLAPLTSAAGASPHDSLPRASSSFPPAMDLGGAGGGSGSSGGSAGGGRGVKRARRAQRDNRRSFADVREEDETDSGDGSRRGKDDEDEAGQGRRPRGAGSTDP
jgi:hypothetical protein